MHKIREILRLRWGCRLPFREVARSLGIGAATVHDCVRRAEVAGLSWPLDDALSDVDLEARLYDVERKPAPRVLPDFAQIHEELRRKDVTLQLLWEEYKEAHPEDGYQYSQFCEHYRRYCAQFDVVLRQEHRAGEKMFVDFSGDGIEIVNPVTGEIERAELFVAVLGASSYTYAEVTPSQDLRSWIQAHIHAYEFFEGVSAITVPDQTRTAVAKPCRYEPGLNRTYEELARHYRTAIVPARPRKPRDKAKVEAGVLLAQRWLVAAVRKHTLIGVTGANEALAPLLAKLNERKFRKLDASRRSLYEKLDRPALQPLPSSRYEIAEWFEARVNIDYHVEVDKHFYSVPYQLARERVEARRTLTTVEVFFKHQRVAAHPRSYDRSHVTLREHMPKAHQRFLEWTPSRIIHWAEKTGSSTAKLVQTILESRPHPEQGYRACLGILRLTKPFGAQRLENACERALVTGACSYHSVRSILNKGLDRQPVLRTLSAPPIVQHENIRGRDYYS